MGGMGAPSCRELGPGVKPVGPRGGAGMVGRCWLCPAVVRCHQPPRGLCPPPRRPGAPRSREPLWLAPGSPHTPLAGPIPQGWVDAAAWDPSAPPLGHPARAASGSWLHWGGNGGASSSPSILAPLGRAGTVGRRAVLDRPPAARATAGGPLPAPLGCDTAGCTGWGVPPIPSRGQFRLRLGGCRESGAAGWLICARSFGMWTCWRRPRRARERGSSWSRAALNPAEGAIRCCGAGTRSRGLPAPGFLRLSLATVLAPLGARRGRCGGRGAGDGDEDGDGEAPM